MTVLQICRSFALVAPGMLHSKRRPPRAISGIGIVNATEVVHAFQGMEGLQDFRAWVQAPDAAVSELIAKATGELAVSLGLLGA